jgi:ESS family glutamate:Na+ symporter
MSDSFHGVIAFAILSALLLLGTILRARIPLLQHALVPASLIGGLIGFGLLAVDGIVDYTSRDFTMFTFHFFTLSFMSLCLTGSAPGSSSKTIVLGGSWLTAVWVVSLAMRKSNYSFCPFHN